MAVQSDSLSVLVVDEEPEILSFFARLLDANGMRALLARDGAEAIGIAKRGYVPIDLVLTDIHLKANADAPGVDSGQELVGRLRELRPEVRALFISAFLDSGVIRIELADPVFQAEWNGSDEGLLGWIRTAASAPLVQRMGSIHRH
jgi:CheY-like chemotaxis protein